MNGVWTLTTQLALVAIIVSIATTIALLLRSRRPLYVRFATFAISISLFYVSALVTTIIEGDQLKETALAGGNAFLASARIVSGAAVVLTASIFFDAILGEAGVSAARRRRKTVFGALVMAVLGATPLATFPGMQGLAAAVAVLLMGARIRAMLLRASDVESAAERGRIRYLAYGGIAAIAGFLFDVGAMSGVPIPAIGGLLVATYLYFISQALLVQRLLDLNELLGKALVFGTLASILALVYGLLTAWVEDQPGLFLFNTLVASVLVLILFDPLRTYLEESATRVFFREHVTFARRVRRLTRDLASVVEVQAAVDLVLDDVYDAKRATHTALFLLDPAGMSFSLQGHRGPRPVPTFGAQTHPQLFSKIVQSHTPLLRESVRRRLEAPMAPERLGKGATKRPADDDADPERAEDRRVEPEAQDEALIQGLDDLCADLIIPVRTDDHVLGFLSLRDERLSEAYASDEIAALMQVGEQVAINVDNSRLFDVVRERDRLATLGEMSAGLAHEIRNPLAAIKGAAQELDPMRINEDDREFLQIIVDEVDRLNSVVTEFLDYARPFRGTFSAIGPNEAVKRTVALLRHDIDDAIELELDLTDQLPDLNGDAEQLQQVLINLVLNAAQALTVQRETHPPSAKEDGLPAGQITLSTRLEETPRSDAQRFGLKEAPLMIEIRVKDNGPGIPDSVKKNLFIPFFTTKTRGTGLGLPLCQRIAQHHGGTLEVRSRPGDGATFILRIPAVGRARPDAASTSEANRSLESSRSSASGSTGEAAVQPQPTATS